MPDWTFFAENASNLRRDLTAETSLMSDLAKELNVVSDITRDTSYTPEPRHHNVNILPDTEQGSNSENSLNNAQSK